MEVTGSEILQKYFDEFTNTQLEQFEALKELYREWNEKINVISRKDMDNFYEHHVLHSLAIATIFEFPSGYEIMDLGTGGGFPAIPLAIFFPEVKFTLVDSINKKLKVAQEVGNAIGLPNIITKHSRAEDIHQQFDVVVSRAVAPLKDLIHWCKPLIKPRPINEPKKISGLICLKGGDLAQEISESSARPKVWEIDKMFDEEYFKEKVVLHVANL